MTRENYEQVSKASEKLKSASEVVGAGRLHYACYYIVLAFNLHDPEGIVQRYPLLIEAAVEFKKYSRRFMAEYKGKS